jgi:CheY-like chemotaxis protein
MDDCILPAARLRRAWFLRFGLALPSIGLFLLMCGAGFSRADNPTNNPDYSALARKYDDHADAASAAKFEQALTNQIAAMANPVEAPKPETRIITPLTVTELVGVALLVWILAAPLVAQFLSGKFKPWVAIVSGIKPGESADDEAYKVFAASLATEPAAKQKVSAPTGSDDADRPAPPERPITITIQQFYSASAVDIGRLQTLMPKLGLANDATERAGILEDILQRLNSIAESAKSLELKSAWQMACALGALMERLAKKPEQASPSCFRTATGGIDLLADLCAPGVPPNLATESPVRLLAVDDNAISLRAIVSALKQIFPAPKLAFAGEPALEQVKSEKFDMIFLDVEMPGMNGFELCAKIRETPHNSETPVVFVTSHENFNTSAQLPLLQAQDLIAKPFMSIELAVKTLTFVLRRRLDVFVEQQKAAENASEKSPSASPMEKGASQAARPDLGLGSVVPA